MSGYDCPLARLPNRQRFRVDKENKGLYNYFSFFGVSMMQIYLPEIRSQSGEAVDYSFKYNLEDCYTDFPEGGILELQVSVTASGSNLVVSGALKASVEMNCARCLQKFEHKFETSFTESFSLVEPIENDYSREDLSAETANRLIVRGDYLYLDEYIRQLIILAQDYSPLCKQECRGLCAGCGIDLNEAACNCKEESSSIDIRMIKLKEFKK